MTKKSDHTLLIAGGLAAVVALGAALLLRRPAVQGGESGGDGAPATNYWQTDTSSFGVHNSIVSSISPYLAPFLGIPTPSSNPLAVFQPGYGAGYYSIPGANLYDSPSVSPPSTSSPSTPPSGFTSAGSASGSSGSSGNIPFGVKAY